MSRVCEEFACLPSEAMREIDRMPAGLLEDIVEMRAVVKAQAAYERAQETKDSELKRQIMADPLVALICAIEFEDVQRGR